MSICQYYEKKCIQIKSTGCTIARDMWNEEGVSNLIVISSIKELLETLIILPTITFSFFGVLFPHIL